MTAEGGGFLAAASSRVGTGSRSLFEWADDSGSTVSVNFGKDGKKVRIAVALVAVATVVAGASA